MIIKREDGSKVKLEIEIMFLNNGKNIHYSVFIYTCAKNKRKFTEINTDYFKYVGLNIEELKLKAKEEYIKYVTKKEIMNECEVAWNKAKPNWKYID